MTQYRVYGSCWFTATYEAKDDQDAKIALLNRLMDLEGVAVEVKELEAEPA